MLHTKQGKNRENYVFVVILIITKFESDARIFIIIQVSFQLRKFLVAYGAQDDQVVHSLILYKNTKT